MCKRMGLLTYNTARPPESGEHLFTECTLPNTVRVLLYKMSKKICKEDSITQCTKIVYLLEEKPQRIVIEGDYRCVFQTADTWLVP